MKLEVNFQKLRHAVQLTERLAQKQSTLPVLSCLLFEIGKGVLVVKSTNLDCGIEVSIPTKSDAIGTVAIPARTITSFVSQIPNNEQIVKLEISTNSLAISTTKSKGLLKTQAAEDFPTIPKVPDGQEFSIPAEIFIKGLTSVFYSSAVSGVKPELSSVYVYNNGEYIVFAATDSFRLAEKKMKAPTGLKMNDILVPFKNISDIVRVLESISGKVKVCSNKNLISFEGDGVYLASRVIDGVFPDYKQIIPKGFGTEAIVLKQDLVNAIKISNVFSDKFNQVHLVIDPKSKVFEIETKNGDVGENKTAVDGAITGEKMEINFNSKYLSDCFQSIDTDSVSLQLSGTNRPMVVRPVSGEQSFMYLVMPMNR